MLRDEKHIYTFSQIQKAPAHSLLCSPSPSPVIRRNSRGAGRHAFTRRFTRLRLLQRRALRPLAHGELEHLSAPSAVASGRLGEDAGFGAGVPLGPLGHLAVLGEDAGLDGQRQVPWCAQAGKGKEERCRKEWRCEYEIDLGRRRGALMLHNARFLCFLCLEPRMRAECPVMETL